MNMLYVAVLTYVAPIDDVELHLAAHMAWLAKGYDEGVFLASGRRVPRTGGVILARGESLDAVEARLHDDPFYKHGVAKVEVFAFAPSQYTAALEGLF